MGLDVQRPPTLGGLQGTDVGVTHWTQKVSRGKASWSGRDLASDVSKVHSSGDREEANEACETDKLCGGLEAEI